MATQPEKARWDWAEMSEEVDDGDSMEFFLPPKQVIGPDEHGVKKVITYSFNEDGKKVKTTQTSKVRTVSLSKGSADRRSWRKFGDAVHEDVGARLTMVSTEEILLERPRAPGSKQEDAKGPGDLNRGAVLMVCRTCHRKGDHWTSRCPYKDLAAPTDTFDEKPSDPSTKSSAYVPSIRRGGERAVTDMKRRHEENSVRISNLSEDAIEADVRELFSPFGVVTRVYVALNKGFGFVNFASRDDAERAINKLNGYGYDNLILKVEWAPPRAN